MAMMMMIQDAINQAKDNLMNNSKILDRVRYQHRMAQTQVRHRFHHCQFVHVITTVVDMKESMQRFDDFDERLAVPVILVILMAMMMMIQDAINQAKDNLMKIVKGKTVRDTKVITQRFD